MAAILIGVLAISRRVDIRGKSIGQLEKVLDVEKRGACDIWGVIGFQRGAHDGRESARWRIVTRGEVCGGWMR